MGTLHRDVWGERLLLVRARLACKQSFFEQFDLYGIPVFCQIFLERNFGVAVCLD